MPKKITERGIQIKEWFLFSGVGAGDSVEPQVCSYVGRVRGDVNTGSSVQWWLSAISGATTGCGSARGDGRCGLFPASFLSCGTPQRAVST